MKKLLLALTAVAGLTGQASAADMAMKAPPMAAPVMGWTGFYAGINGGGAWSDGPSMTYTDLANIGNTTNAYRPSTVDPSSSTSGLAGFHLGYNWQVAPTWVLGLEGDWDWTNLNASGTNNLFGAINNAGGTFGLLRDNVTLPNQSQLACQRSRSYRLFDAQFAVVWYGRRCFRRHGP